MVVLNLGLQYVLLFEFFYHFHICALTYLVMLLRFGYFTLFLLSLIFFPTDVLFLLIVIIHPISIAVFDMLETM